MNHLSNLHEATKDVSAKNLFNGEIGSTVSIQLKANGILKEHMTKTPALLICVLGHVVYHDEKGTAVKLKPGEYFSIEPNVSHWIQSFEDSQLILLK